MEAQGTRLDWKDIPDDIRRLIETALGAPVRRADNQAGGFSPGLAARCELADGRRRFVKAVSAAQNPHSPALHRREALIAHALPAGLPVPALLAVVERDDWVVLIFEEVEGEPPTLPWSMAGLRSLFAALDDIATSTPPVGLESFADRFANDFRGFRSLRPDDVADPWIRAHLDTLVSLESEWESAARGDALLHADLRADNLLVRPDGCFVIVDWPHATVGAAWVDKVCFLPSVGLDGGPTPAAVEQALAPFAGVDPADIDRVLAGLAGYFVHAGMQPDPPGLPTLRAFQRAQGAVAVEWLADRLDQRGHG